MQLQLFRTELLLVLALLGLGSLGVLGQSSEPRLFIDDNGDICSDTVEVVQKLLREETYESYDMTSTEAKTEYISTREEGFR